MQEPHGTASSFVDNPVISPPQRSSYLAVVMGTVQLWPNWSGDGGQKRKWRGWETVCMVGAEIKLKASEIFFFPPVLKIWT